jgi:hypothetical protein
MKRVLPIAVALCLFMFVILVPFAEGQYERLDYVQLEKETTEKILCEPFDERQYPPRFLEAVNRTKENIKENGGVAIIGRIRYKDGSRVEPNDITFRLQAAPPFGEVHNCYPFEDGWFCTGNLHPGPISKRILDEAEANGRPRGLCLAVLSMDCFPSPTAVFRIKQGEIIYLTFELEKVPPEKRITVSGTVRDETGQPLRSAHVGLSLAGSTGSDGREPRKETTTGVDGRFVFDNLAPRQYAVIAHKHGLQGDGTLVSPPKVESDRTVVSDLILWKQKKIVLDFVYQPDGSRDFTKGDLKPQTVEWHPHSGPMLFKEGKVNRETRQPDLELFAVRENLFFYNGVYVTSGNGVYSAGEVPFDSVVEAKEGNHHYRDSHDGDERGLPVKKNHVYVVKTYTGEYVKLIVRDIITIEPQAESPELRNRQ